ncbi:MAG TPA: PEGA domain-containing protein [Planctomycetota bacterium]|nr:PEGA domain-containing protein [Planctomycetota bacterium]
MRFFIIFVAALAAGCIQRTMRIETDPPGATVWIDDERCGETPVDVPFTAYGTRRILLQMEDHQARGESAKLIAPWYSIFPIDFFTDVLCPFTFHDVKSFHYEMQPLGPTDMKALEQRANEFAEQAKDMLAEERRKRNVPDPQPAQKAPTEPAASQPAAAQQKSGGN